VASIRNRKSSRAALPGRCSANSLLACIPSFSTSGPGRSARHDRGPTRSSARSPR
jgi:hypothetical protein